MLIIINEVKTMKAKCNKCDYEWDTQSRLMMVSCPSCGQKVKIRDAVIKDD